MKILEVHINVTVFHHYSLLEVREIFEHEFEGKTYTQDDVLYAERYPTNTEGWQDIMTDVAYFQHKLNTEAKFYNGLA
jgi:hypothetical protein